MNGYKEQNYWPGFVDALSNVVLTLVFVLVVFVFALVLTSDKLQERVEQLKNSVQVETAAKQKAVEEKISVEVEKQQVVKRLDETAARLLEMERDNRRLKANLGQVQPQTQENLQHKAQQLAAKNRQIEAQLKAAIAQLNQLGVKAPLPDDASQEHSTGREQESLIKEQKTIQVLAGDAAAAKGDVEFRKSGGAIILVFPRNIFKLDDKSKVALDKALQAHKEKLSTSAASVISIMGAETYSESRRLAYFRGLSVRNYLMASGYSSGRTVHVQIEQDKGVKDGRVEIRFLKQ